MLKRAEALDMASTAAAFVTASEGKPPASSSEAQVHAHPSPGGGLRQSGSMVPSQAAVFGNHRARGKLMSRLARYLSPAKQPRHDAVTSVAHGAGAQLGSGASAEQYRRKRRLSRSRPAPVAPEPAASNTVAGGALPAQDQLAGAARRLGYTAPQASHDGNLVFPYGTGELLPVTPAWSCCFVLMTTCSSAQTTLRRPPIHQRDERLRSVGSALFTMCVMCSG